MFTINRYECSRSPEYASGLGSTSQPSATVPAMGSKLIKFYFKIPSQQEPLTFSNAWGTAGEAGKLGMAITFVPYPMNITWLNVKTVNYEYSGLPQKQGWD